MQLNLIRDTFTTHSTTGKLLIDDVFFCYTLEDVVRPFKIPKETAIPAGRYRVEIANSISRGRDMPRLISVPGFEGILIHWGNWAKDTEGCILVGSTRSIDFIGHSKDTFDRLFPRLQAAASEGIWISISEQGRPAELTQSFEQGSRVRVLADMVPVMQQGEIALFAVHGSELEVAAGSQSGAVIAVTGFDADGGKIAGTVAVSALEAVPLDDAGDTLPAKEWRVNASTLFLRSSPGTTTDETVIARLPRGQLLRKLAAVRPLPWWQVRTVLGNITLTGYCHSGFLLPAAELPSVTGRPSSGNDRVQLSERALTLIVDAEDNDQPSAWPGGDSGITIGIGYDLGYQTVDRFRGDWGAEISAADVDLLSTAIGLRAARARAVASRFAQIRIARAAAEAVFQRCSVPRMCADALRTFPGMLDLPIDAQGALVSVVFNRGTDMGDPTDPLDRRVEMRQIRATVGSPSLPMDQKLRRISESLRGMKRLWQGKKLGGLIRRREDEARLVESCLA